MADDADPPSTERDALADVAQAADRPNRVHVEAAAVVRYSDGEDMPALAQIDADARGLAVAIRVVDRFADDHARVVFQLLAERFVAAFADNRTLHLEGLAHDLGVFRHFTEQAHIARRRTPDTQLVVDLSLQRLAAAFREHQLLAVILCEGAGALVRADHLL